MKQEENKLREFWLIYEPPYSPWISRKPLFCADVFEEIHVIEYSAFENLQKENEQLKAKLEKAKITLREVKSHNIRQYDKCSSIEEYLKACFWSSEDTDLLINNALKELGEG